MRLETDIGNNTRRLSIVCGRGDCESASIQTLIGRLYMSKRDVKRKILLLRLLSYIDRGMYVSQIAKSWGWSKQRLFPYIKALLKSGLIEKKMRTSFVLYELTTKGKEIIIRTDSLTKDSIRLHNVSYKAEILSGNAPRGAIHLNGWNKWLKRERNATIEVTTKSVIVYVSALFGNNAFDLENKARNIAKNTFEDFKAKMDIELGEPFLNRVPHFAVDDPIIKELSQYMEITTETGKIDESEGHGEIDYFNPETAKNYLDMPNRLERLENNFERFIENIGKYNENIELHLSVLQKMSDTLDAIKESLKK